MPDNNTVKKALENIKKLVRIPAWEGQEAKVIDYLEKLFSKKFPSAKLRKKKVKGNLFNLYCINSPFLISFHVDTVPPLGMQNPTKLKVERDRVVARGVCDVKGQLGCFLTALEIYQKKHRKFPPISFAFVVDEERVSALGSEKLAPLLRDKVDFVLVVEPTYGKICTAQEGSLEFIAKAKVSSAHASEFEKFQNPSKKLFEFVGKVERELERPVNILRFSSGWEYYAVPPEAEGLFEVKLKKGERTNEIFERIKKVSEAEVEVEIYDAEEFLDFGKLEEGHPLVRALERTEGKAEFSVMPSWTDATNYHKAGIRCAIFGYGNIADCHTPREHLTFDEIRKQTEFFLNLFEELSS